MASTPKTLISLLIVCVFINCSGKLSQDVIDSRTHHFTLYSKFVKDSFDVYVSLPDNYNANDTGYHTIYYLDANLKSGKAYRHAIHEYRKQKKLFNVISVGIGHFGNYRELRRRDLITPFVKSKGDSLVSDENNFGHCEEFYQLLQFELIPLIEKEYNCNGDRSLVGHSLGGLFAFYCLFKKQHLFRNHVALSPALWINYGNIYSIEENYHNYSDTLNAALYLCTGTRERLNKILDGGRKMKSHLEKRNYQKLKFVYMEFEGETHNSEVPMAYAMILPALINQ